ncbi:hypothetical protein C0992_001147 [Termitomyces sp. T32_za158]|nr:hypothetical protein C0992_001147 [Termitomyces sp. T32_za158]
MSRENRVATTSESLTLQACPRQSDVSVDAKFEKTRIRHEACLKLVDETVEGARSYDSFTQGIKDLGLNATEAECYFDAGVQRSLDLRRAKSQAQPAPSRFDKREGLHADQLAASRKRSSACSDRIAEPGTSDSHANAVEAAACASSRSQLGQALALVGPTSTLPLSQTVELLGDIRDTSDIFPIPQSVLAAAPHLVQLQANAAADPYLAKTWKLRQVYRKGKVIDSLVNLGQLQRVHDPIPRAIWKLVILDDYVDFEELYATLYKGYNHYDRPKDFAGGSSFVKKDHATVKRPILSESDWTRAFDAWMVAVLTFYPHREAELVSYRGMVIDLFRLLPDAAAIPIRLDCHTRDRYARNPFRMDENELQARFLTQLICASASSTLPIAGIKRSRRKRSVTICQNWNLGCCNSDSCPGNRRHNICCECHGRHSAQENEECLAKLRARRQNYRAASGVDASSGQYHSLSMNSCKRLKMSA